jgi:hypothetical protein
MDGTSRDTSSEVVAGQLAVIGPKLESLVVEVRALGGDIATLRTELGDHAATIQTELRCQRELLEKVLTAVGAGRNTRPVALLEYTAFSELEARARHFMGTMSVAEPDQDRAAVEMGTLFDAIENLDAVRETTSPGAEEG